MSPGPCTPLGTSSPNLGLCKPATGETNWGAPADSNFDLIDALFTGGQDLLLGRTHVGLGAELKQLIAGAGILVTAAAGQIVIAAVAPGAPLRSYLSGLGLSNDIALPNTVLDIAAGQSVSDDQTTLMNQPAAYTKSTAAWAVGSGNGGLDTGVVAASTWYHVFQIERTDTGVVDYLFSLSPTAPTLPASYTKQRRIGSVLTDGAVHLVAFTQDGDFVEWLVPVLDINDTAPGTAAVTKTLASVPTGVRVQWVGNGTITSTTAGAHAAYFSDLASTDLAPGLITNPVAQLQMPPGIAGAMGAGQLQIRTNTLGQVRYRCTVSDAATKVVASTVGYWDRRGRDA